MKFPRFNWKTAATWAAIVAGCAASVAMLVAWTKTMATLALLVIAAAQLAQLLRRSPCGSDEQTYLGLAPGNVVAVASEWMGEPTLCRCRSVLRMPDGTYRAHLEPLPETDAEGVAV